MPSPQEQAENNILDETLALPSTESARDPYIGTKFDHAKLTAIPVASKIYKNITSDLAFGYTNGFLDIHLQNMDSILEDLMPFQIDFPLSCEAYDRTIKAALWLSKSRGGFEGKIQRTGIFKQESDSTLTENSKRRGFMFGRNKQEIEENM